MLGCGMELAGSECGAVDLVNTVMNFRCCRKIISGVANGLKDSTLWSGLFVDNKTGFSSRTPKN